MHHTVGHLARAAGLTVRTLHHWDEIGLLRPAQRSGAGHRRYSDADVARLFRIVALRRLGLSLDAVGAALEAEGPGPRPWREWGPSWPPSGSCAAGLWASSTRSPAWTDRRRTRSSTPSR